MMALLQKQLREKIDNLLKIYQGLKKLQRLTLDDLRENIENVWAVSFGMVAAIEAVLDIGQYILADRGVKIESYGKIPLKLFESGIIDKEFSEKMQKMVGFRNRAIHNYPSLEEKQLYQILQEDIDDFKEFLGIVNQYTSLSKTLI